MPPLRQIAVGVLVAGLSAFVGPVAGPAAASPTSAAAEVAEVAVTSDIAYGSALDEDGETEALLLDLYNPGTASGARRPAILWMHGGGFTQGDKADATDAAAATQFARQGYVTASVNYRLQADVYPEFPRASLDAQHDVQAAVRWMRAHADELRVDPNRISLAGFSAGAVASLRAASHPNDPGDSGTPGVASNVASVVAVSGYMKVEPGPGAPPALMLHGTDDQIVPLAWAEETCASWRDRGAPCRLIAYEGGSHDLRVHLDDMAARLSQFLACRVGVPIGFSDVRAGGRAETAVSWVLALRLAGGYADGTFRPHVAATRAQLADWLWDLLGQPVPVRRTRFADVPRRSRIATAASWLTETGAVSAEADGSFDPSGSVTRGEVAMALWTVSGSSVGSVSEYPDVDASAWYAAGVDWLVAHRIASGFADGTFRPDAPVTRAQLAGFLRMVAGTPEAWAERPGRPLCFHT